jgi:glutathione synthase
MYNSASDATFILTEEQKLLLQELSIDWAYSNGLVIKAGDGSVHAPVALFPTPISKSCFQDALRLQPIYNILVDRVARDKAFLQKVMDDLSLHDTFTARVYEIYKESLSQPLQQNIWLGLHRSDYMLHFDGHTTSIKQVEMNTISSSFSSLSSKVSEMHEYIYKRTGFFSLQTLEMPPNEAGVSFADGLAAAFNLYNNPNAVVMMIVQPGENNVYDQRWIEQQLLQRHGISLIRRTLKQVHERATLNGSGELVMDSMVVAITYYRAGYTPNDYPTEDEWSARKFIEFSKSIKCPNAAYHLVGTKKMQQVLADPVVLSNYLESDHCQELLKSFVGLYPLDSSPEGKKALEMALRSPKEFVLKPQREGGGVDLLK